MISNSTELELLFVTTFSPSTCGSHTPQDQYKKKKTVGRNAEFLMLKYVIPCFLTEAIPLCNNNCIIYTVNTQQHQYSNIGYAIGYTMATCFDLNRHHQANKEHFV